MRVSGGIVPVIVNAYYGFVIAIHFILCLCFDENAAAVRLNACNNTVSKCPRYRDKGHRFRNMTG